MKNTISSFYGNPILCQKEIMESNELKSLLNLIQNKNPEIWKSWINTQPPTLKSSEVIEDLYIIINNIKKQSVSDVIFIDRAEKNKEEIFVKLLQTKNVDIKEDFLKKITYYLDPITLILKYNFNYPRPYQAAFLNSIPMYPSIATNASSPSYPSGHSIDSLVIGYVLSKLYPAHKNEIMQTAYQISLSRYISGIHFSFDMIFGETIGEYIGHNYSYFFTDNL